MEYIYFLDGNYYTVHAVCPSAADRALNALVGTNSASGSATLVRVAPFTKAA